MESFQAKLDKLLQAAANRRLVNADQSKALLDLARERERSAGPRRLAMTFGGVGAVVLLAGVVMTLDWLKLSPGAWAVLLLIASAAAHAGAYRLRALADFEKTAESVHLVGALLLPVGLGLAVHALGWNVPPSLILFVWLTAIVPQAWVTRSPFLAGFSALAFLATLHAEGFREGSPVRMSGMFSSSTALEIGIGLALAGLSARIRPKEPGVAAALRGLATVLLFYGVYVLGFYRVTGSDKGSAVLPALTLALGAAGLAWAGPAFAPEHPRLARYLRALLWMTLAVTALSVGIDTFVAPAIDWNRSHPAAWAVAAAAAVLWFLLALWCIAYGSAAGLKEFVNVGVHGVTLGILTRFFDLFWDADNMGLLCIGGGVLLILAAAAAERWRKRLLANMGSAAKVGAFTTATPAA